MRIVRPPQRGRQREPSRRRDRETAGPRHDQQGARADRLQQDPAGRVGQPRRQPDRAVEVAEGPTLHPGRDEPLDEGVDPDFAQADSGAAHNLHH